MTKKNSFDVGDHVMVITERFGANQLGGVGSIESIDGIGLPIRVRFFPHSTYAPLSRNAYDYCDLEFLNGVPMVEPEFSLEEMELAESLIHD